MNTEENHTNSINTTPSDDTEMQKEVKLVDIPIKDENTALNIMVSFLSLAHKRGAFGIDESAKIWECIKMFQKNV
jgi:hypothetical protein